VVIAAYTLVDGKGVRLSGSPASYAMWVLLLAAAPMVCWAIVTRRTAFLRYALANCHGVLAGGVGALGSFVLALWAMTHAPIAVVAALRETSILFGMAIAALVLKEVTGRRRLLAAGLITLGAIALRLA
jgi:drug/metabolite transporter (DMT)-like permease